MKKSAWQGMYLIPTLLGIAFVLGAAMSKNVGLNHPLPIGIGIMMGGCAIVLFVTDPDTWAPSDYVLERFSLRELGSYRARKIKLYLHRNLEEMERFEQIEKGLNQKHLTPDGWTELLKYPDADNEFTRNVIHHCETCVRCWDKWQELKGSDDPAELVNC